MDTQTWTWKTKKGKKKGQSITAIVKTDKVIERGKTVGWVALIKDVTNLKLIEKKSRESEKKYEEIFKNVNEGIILLDLKQPDLN